MVFSVIEKGVQIVGQKNIIPFKLGFTSVTPGVNDAYGTGVDILPPDPGYFIFPMQCALEGDANGAIAPGETITALVEATYEDGTVNSGAVLQTWTNGQDSNVFDIITGSSNVPSSYVGQLYILLTNGKRITKLTIYAKSDQASTNAAVGFVFSGMEYGG